MVSIRQKIVTDILRIMADVKGDRKMFRRPMALIRAVARTML